MMLGEPGANAPIGLAPMIVTSTPEFLAAYRDGAGFPRVAPAVPRAALLVTPHGFRVSEESAADNRYMTPGTTVDLERAHEQHAALARCLSRLGVPVVTLPGRDGLDDAVYPNNIYATSRASAGGRGRFIVGSMRHPVRQKEAAREDVRSLFTRGFGYELVDLSQRDCIAELTGALIIDYSRRIGFCGQSGRVDDAGCAAMHEAFELRLTWCFDLVPGEYHTNIVLAVLAGRACVVHPPSFADPEILAALRRAFSDRTLVLDDDEKAAFAGNCIAMTEHDVLFSATSMARLRPSSLAALESWGFRTHAVEVDEIEKGGGSLRCLIAEIF